MNKFISYAQNCEDVMLWRALQGVANGYYIDIGANHPTIDSVTKAFYERGWHGINIEPVRFLYDQLVLDRPRDINLCSAVSSRNGHATFYEVIGTGLSTLEHSVADEHARAGYKVISYDVPVTTMAEVCDARNVSVVHFLKIDVEGAEEQVLQGMSFHRVKPWIIVVESTKPNTQIPSYEKWEPLILTQGYSYVYFDGANRYYLSSEHAELASAFHVQPNIFDNFIQYPYWSLQQEMTLVRKELSACQIRLAEIRASWSWRLTRPLRGLTYFTHWLLDKSRRPPHE